MRFSTLAALSALLAFGTMGIPAAQACDGEGAHAHAEGTGKKMAKKSCKKNCKYKKAAQVEEKGAKTQDDGKS
jgi:hypothetical protein